MYIFNIIDVVVRSDDTSAMYHGALRKSSAPLRLSGYVHVRLGWSDNFKGRFCPLIG